MAAFDKVSSGFTGLDQTLDHIRMGDNVVWQVTSVEEYRYMMQLFARQALADHRQLIYIRFAPHPPILFELPGLTIHVLDPAEGFETFTSEVHRIIAEAGKDAFYVFDSLSELQTAWAADLMMGNFFVVTCPYLFELDTVACFCLLRHRHSFDTVARIRDTTQLLLDLYPDEDCLYIHPLKVWKRFSPTMFFPHRICKSSPQEIFPLTDGVSVSRFYQLIGTSSVSSGQNLDSWERFFLDTREQLDSGDAPAGKVRELAERLVGNEGRLLDLIEVHFSPAELLLIKERMIGSGKIGGKAAGMLLARQILARRLPDLAPSMEPHDSFFLGSDIFYTYLVSNKLWKLRIAQRMPEGYYTLAPQLAEGIREGKFPERIREQFIRMLEYFGQNPIIVRSSSLLEDSFGHAFAGKYESVFCVNTGSPEDRLHAFEDAVRTVYASTMDDSALAYRQQRGLQGQDEQMAILVQRVSGSLFGDFFMPGAAGVGFSFNNWRWHPDLDPTAGMIRLVAGLGTRAVDRTGSDYPRLVSLDRPDLESSPSVDRSRYCQRQVDCLDLVSRSLVSRELDQVIPAIPRWLLSRLFEHDSGAEQMLRESGRPREVWLGTCRGVVQDPDLLQVFRKMMETLQQEYANPVDIEFTINWAQDGEYHINLLQCRPLQSLVLSAQAAGPGLEPETVSALPAGDLFLYVQGNTMGPQTALQIDAVLMIDPLKYYELPYRDKPSVARVVGRLNSLYRERNQNVMLLTPGRIGTSSPELGLPVSFAEINGMKVICEVACSQAGYQPELSYGSHFFQDLVESGIFYCAVSEDRQQALFQPTFFADEKDVLSERVEATGLQLGLLRVYEPSALMFYSDVLRGSCLCVRKQQETAS